METKANYVLVGVFTLIVSLLAFAFVFWIARFGEARDSLELDVRIPGSVTGLSIGSQVLFNGIKVGDVRALRLDPSNPEMVFVNTLV
jgi:phospholipid/cholesterol/gamma-HCH transport system substrate-binding protein